MRSLPTIVDERNKYHWGVAALLLFVGLYAVINSMNWREPTVLVPSAIDDSIPMIPATVWIYLSYLVISPVAYVMEHDSVLLTRFLYAQLAANLVSALVFVVWPSTFPRPALDPDVGISHSVLHLVWSVDEPVNCFPSLHVSSSLLAALMMWPRGAGTRIVFAVWALAIAGSTLTTKQHHVVDVVGGVALATSLYWLFFERINVRGESS